MRVEFSPEAIAEMDRERFMHPHPSVRRRMTVVWAKSHGFNHDTCALMGGVEQRTVRRYLEAFQKGGLNRLRELRWKGRERRLQPYMKTLEAELQDHPPQTIAEAAERIEKMTKVRIQPTQVRAFLHSLGLKWRKIAAIPVPPKLTVEEHVTRQREFLDQQLNPLLIQAQANQGHVFFVDAAHFVLGQFLCCLWSRCRLFVKASPGRQRFNVLGAWNAVTGRFVSVCNTTVVNHETFCELLRKIAALGLTGSVSLVLDNARYQHCAACIDFANQLKINLLFLPSYSPNLNLIERIWKFIKKECLYGRYFPSFADFHSRIEDCLKQFDSAHKTKLKSLMALNFQTFESRSILTA